ncbi:MAG: glutamate synthase large subunit [Opitutales bacterium]
MANFIPSPLYRSDFEHDACGVGFIARVGGERTHEVIEQAVAALKRLAHRGAIDADAVTGDGAGILTQLPIELFREFLESQDKVLYGDGDLGAGMLFLPREDEYIQAHSKHIVENAVKKEGLAFLGWREVPVDTRCLGQKSLVTRPLIVQALVAKMEPISEDEFERKLYLVQKISERQAAESNIEGFYICSFSCRTIVYKGLLNAPQIRKFFLDFKAKEYRSSFAIFHQRYSTNTFPTWHLAQPFRMMAHNGEINTIRGNRNMMSAREFSDDHGIWGEAFDLVTPVVQPGMSDSASFDNALQAITLGGRSSIHACQMMMPTAWEKNEALPPEVRDFFHYHSSVIEPWDGPAAVVFSDGRHVGAALDRNGLRPARYKIYDDGTVFLASEVGLISHKSAKVIESGRLGPGHMIAIDLAGNKVLGDHAIKGHLSGRHDYGEFCRESFVRLEELTPSRDGAYRGTVPAGTKLSIQLAFGYDLDEIEMILAPMAEKGGEPTGSMGDDTPLAILSRRPRLLYTYFKQLFAQVTNPAIDSIREKSVMSLDVALGGELDSVFQEKRNDKRLVEADSPFLTNPELESLAGSDSPLGKVIRLPVSYPVENGPEGLEEAVHRLAQQACDSVEKDGVRLIVLSDREVDASTVAIPMLLATGAVQQQLVRRGQRLKCGIVCETGEARDVHQMATLLGFGANAVNPYMAYEIIADLHEEGKFEEVDDLEVAFRNYRNALNNGLLKIMAKMGISTLFSYQGAQVFEALGLHGKLIEECFTGVPSPIGGISYLGVAQELFRRHEIAFPPGGEPKLENEGYYRVNRRGGEFHGWNPKVVAGMHKFVRSGSEENFKKYVAASDDHPPVALKDLMRLRFSDTPVPLAEVEAVEEIRRRFTTAGMSLGAISPETHECLAIAMNAIGGKSNSGEGGEDPERFFARSETENANSAIKQVASGRFGVTAEYLASAKEIEIKIAQGAKPGEGGQLPGHKVSPLIARLRFSVPGVTLISPPPHHDIYSIEDLAQLIFDLKEVNPRAKVCVKLVSSSGVGTVAAGVAKAYADVILISGHEGGTGASPVSSIKNAGSAWEIGVAEAHQVLMMNDLRGRVVLRTDGGMKTGRDIVIASILGAEEYNFGTSALIAAGCAMFRVCHLNTCPVGVATQREDLRAKFKGKPENIINFFNGVAEDVRQYLARLGYRTLDEIIGRVELLEQIDDPENPKTKNLDLSGLFHNPDPGGDLDRIHKRERNDRFGNEGSVDDSILQDAKTVISMRSDRFAGTYKVNNTNRCIGTHLSGEVAFARGNTGLKPGSIDLTLKGSAGQSFGTFLIQGIRLSLIGEANDYVGKGMNGGEIVIRPRPEEEFSWHENIIMGNTCLYGATGGALFAAGCAGERFGVRNSGATAVVEGIGDHGCEYMTGGVVVVLGPTGQNFGAGMSGGIAFVYDADRTFKKRFNPEMIDIERLESPSESAALKQIVKRQEKATGSPWSRCLLDAWEETVGGFWKVVPHPSSPGLPKPVLKLEENPVEEVF